MYFVFAGSSTPMFGYAGWRSVLTQPSRLGTVQIDDIKGSFEVDGGYWDVEDASPTTNDEYETLNSAFILTWIYNTSGNADIRALYVDDDNHWGINLNTTGGGWVDFRVGGTSQTLIISNGTFTNGERVYAVFIAGSLSLFGSVAGWVNQYYGDDAATPITAAMIAERTVKLANGSGVDGPLYIGLVFGDSHARNALGALGRISGHLPDPNGLAFWSACQRPFRGDEQVANEADRLGSTHANGSTPFWRGAGSAASTDDPAWVADPDNQDVGLSFDGSDRCNCLDDITIVGDAAIAICFKPASFNSRLLDSVANVVNIELNNSTTVYVKWTDLSIFTVPAIATDKYHIMIGYRIGETTYLALDGTIQEGNTDPSVDNTVSVNVIGTAGASKFFNGNIASMMIHQKTHTPSSIAALTARIKQEVMDHHGLVATDFA